MHTHKLKKFTPRVKRMIAALGAYQEGLQGHQHVDQFHYMQKLEELALLEDNISETLKRLKFLQERFESEYTEVYCRWRKDVRWMNKWRGKSFSSAEKCK